MTIVPRRIYQSELGIWRAEIKRSGVIRWFSLRTRDEAEARRKWRDYCEIIRRADTDRD